MQIQRIQTVYLLIATVLMAIFVFVPFGSFHFTSEQAAEFAVIDMPTYKEFGVLIPAALSAILLLIDIFMYRNLPRQRTVLLVSVMLTLCTALVVCFTLFKGLEGYEPRFSWWGLLVVAAFVFEILAMKGINHDQKLLASYNRIR
ncbi:MAG: DUF4293 domain-containing protein [Duncaniella sp.]|nr:DUF4293 domain-containing protein [Duncaniella sp.]